jgi:hypothetical protein
MSNKVLDAFARQAAALFTRRRTMQGIGLGTLSAIMTGFDNSLAKNNKKKKRRKRKRRKKRKKRKKSSPPTCAELCAVRIDFCFERAADSTLCGNSFNTQCTSCSSDQDCVGSAFAYCLDEVILRETGEPSIELIDQCGEFVEAVCASVTL